MIDIQKTLKKIKRENQRLSEYLDLDVNFKEIFAILIDNNKRLVVIIEEITHSDDGEYRKGDKHGYGDTA